MIKSEHYSENKQEVHSKAKTNVVFQYKKLFVVVNLHDLILQTF